mmetsp:Transcript_18225/g.21077  ORF Transcript_18225/g.21077 Transcript_18225/m.21077 type:complete len:596 (-) Transcript_18225:1588-3375(-)
MNTMNLVPTTEADASNSAAKSKKISRRRGAKAREKMMIEGQPKLKKDNRNPSTTTSLFTNEKDSNEKAVLVAGKGKTKKRKRKKESNVPKPGEESYKTPTQLRNARKRKAKRRKQDSVTSDMVNDSIGTKGKLARKGEKRGTGRGDDPSTQYISNPLACPLVVKAKQYFDQLDIPFETHMGEKKNWRTVSKLPVRRTSRDSSQECTIGLFKPNSHTIVSVPDCTAHHPSINNAITSLQSICNELKIKPFEETNGTGYLRYVCINIERCSGNPQITLVWNSSPFDYNHNKNDYDSHDNNDNDNDKNEPGNQSVKLQLKALIHALHSKKEELKIHSLWVHFNAQWKHADNIFDFGTSTTCHALWKHIYGPKHIIETLDMEKNGPSEAVNLHFPPNVFRQANLDAFTKIIIAIRKYLTQYNIIRSSKQNKTLPTCSELYGGVGTLGLSLHDLTGFLLSSDENPFNEDCFMKSVNCLTSKVHKDKIKYISKNAKDMLQDDNVTNDKEGFEILVVDPPRKGLDDFVLQSLMNDRVQNKKSALDKTKLLVYVSCGFDAFQRDCNALLKSNRWKLDYAEGHVLFPGSNAIETLAFFKSKIVK